MIWIHKYIEPCNSPHRMIDVDFLRLMMGTAPWGKVPILEREGVQTTMCSFLMLPLE